MAERQPWHHRPPRPRHRQVSRQVWHPTDSPIRGSTPVAPWLLAIACCSTRETFWCIWTRLRFILSSNLLWVSLKKTLNFLSLHTLNQLWAIAGRGQIIFYGRAGRRNFEHDCWVVLQRVPPCTMHHDVHTNNPCHNTSIFLVFIVQKDEVSLSFLRLWAWSHCTQTMRMIDSNETLATHRAMFLHESVVTLSNFKKQITQTALIWP